MTLPGPAGSSVSVVTCAHEVSLDHLMISMLFQYMYMLPANGCSCMELSRNSNAAYLQSYNSYSRERESTKSSELYNSLK